VYEIVDLPRPPGSLDILTRASVTRTFPALRSDYGRFCAASYVIEFVDALTPDGQTFPAFYDLAVSTLEALDRTAPVAATVFSFEARGLRMLGYLPRTGACGGCGRAIGPEAYFGCRDGGAVCVRCRPRDPRRVLLKREVFRTLGRLASEDPPAAPLSRYVRDMLRKILDDYVRYVMEREPRSMRFMREAVLHSTP
jgi:DNA repair protein RecO (recombination protein O)